MKSKKHPNFQDLYSIEDIKKAKQCFNHTGYYPISLMPGNQYAVLGNTGHLGKYHLNNTSNRTYTLKYWYAMQVWNTAIATTCNSLVGNDFLYILPHWEDRNDSFRKLVNNERFNPEMVTELWRLLEDIANSGNIKVHEGFFIENATNGYFGAPSKCHIETKCKFNIHIILDVGNVRNIKFPVKDIWKHPFCKDDKTYKWEEIKHFFCEVSLPVRELINHEWMRRAGENDSELFKACKELNLDGIKSALAKGANINAFDDFDETPLTSAIKYYKSKGMHADKKYNKEEYEEFEKTNYRKLLPIIDYLLDNGADIDLFGYEGNNPLIAAHYEHSAPLVEYLLKKGANPNVNCFLTDCFDETIYRSTVLSCIYEDCDSDDEDCKIKSLVKQYGGRLYYWGYNPVKREYTDRIFLGIWPTKEMLFEDSAYDNCGDYKTLHIEIADDEFVDIDISSLEDDWKQWHKEVVEDYYEERYIKTETEWNEWFDRGLVLAKQLKKLLPDNVDLYYLYDSKPIFCTRKDGGKYWNQWDGGRVLIE